MHARIVVIDDSEVRQVGLRRLLEGELDWTVVGSGEVDALGALVAEHAPDVVVVSTGREPEEIVAALVLAARRCPGVGTVVVSPHRDRSALSAALNAGAAGYVASDDVLGGVIEAVRMIGEPAPYVSSSLGAALATEDGTPSELGLTERETIVLRLVALGHTNAEIAARLSLSVRTIEAQRSRVQRKLGAANRVELVRLALAHGFIDRSDGAA
jgi:DNA-binding NarL/FixJ family response regulator